MQGSRLNLQLQHNREGVPAAEEHKSHLAVSKMPCTLTVAVASQLYTLVQRHWFVQFQQMQFVVHEFYLSKADYKKGNWKRTETGLTLVHSPPLPSLTFSLGCLPATWPLSEGSELLELLSPSPHLPHFTSLCPQFRDPQRNYCYFPFRKITSPLITLWLLQLKYAQSIKTQNPFHL